jgi:hypothetical protein
MSFSVVYERSPQSIPSRNGIGERAILIPIVRKFDRVASRFYI